MGAGQIHSAMFMAVRFVEGCAHIFALSLVLAHASAMASDRQRGRVMGMVGAGLLLGVALGARLGRALVAGGVSQFVAASHGWQTGYSTAFVVAGLSEVLCVLLTIPWLRRLAAPARDRVRT